MNLKQLSHFIALIEHRNFGRAADACNITQPAFSRSIRSLEDELGCQLVDRHSGRNLQPTSQGERVLQHAVSVLRGVADISAEVKGSTPLDMGEVRLGVGPVPAASLVPRAVARFLNLYPRMQVHLDVENWQKLNRSLQREELDFLVAASPPFLNNPRYDIQLLRAQRMGLFCRRGHPLLDARHFSPQKLFSFPFALAGASREQLFEHARLYGVSAVRIGIECDNIYTLLSVIEQSDVIGLIHSHSFEQALAAGSVVRLSELPDSLQNIFARYAIVLTHGRTLSPAAERLRQMIVEADGQPFAEAAMMRLAN